MKFLPHALVAVDPSGRPLAPDKCFQRVGPLSSEARLRSEKDWDDIICANVDALSEALRVAEVIPADSTLRVLGQQIDCVDVLLAEVAMQEGASADGDDDFGEPRRLVLLEDKLVRNPEAKRQVLAQVLDYAQRAQQEWTTEFLCSQPALASHAAWLNRYEKRLDVILGEGDLLLVIAGDDIDADLLRLAKRFASANDPLSLNEMCLVSLAQFRRGDEYLLVPHVVSAVERHQRQVTIRVRVQDATGAPLRALVERDVESDLEDARSGAPPVNPAAEAFLGRVRKALEPNLLVPGSPYESTPNARKALEYWTTTEDGSRVRFKVHFGGYARDLWSPIQVGLYVESRTSRDTWRARIEDALAAGRLPVGTKLTVAGKLTVSALKEYPWSAPADLTDALVEDVADTLLRFEAEFGIRKP